MTSLLYHILKTLFPKRCFGCDIIVKEDEDFLCSACFSKIRLHQTLFCPVCRARLAENKRICHKNSGYFLGAAAQYEEGLVKKIIWRLKYEKKPAAAQPLGKILAIYLQSLKLTTKDYLIIPVPLHPKKEHQRGFNQSLLIAKIISKNFNWELSSDCLLKIENTPPQMEIKDWEQRQENIAGSFTVAKPELIAGKNILLIDDVVTSGSTFNESVKILKAAGARKIIAVAVAKAR